MKIEIEITDEDAAALRVLGHDRHSRDGCEPHETLRDLLERIHDGVYRPGSWERGVLLQLFGDLWLAAMERDPEVEWRQRPKARFRR